ncbi:Acidic leucine-rich nuclear phosphoprotein 32-related protein [Zea mays]|uniref:Acidic leucine-rich nuclear phosphoprotein 32-related protein n=1 Tax=Zea mays TaxID=4577 RepID=A0A1D6KYW7_MAIZE|nr:Acidic leucine-rich nuclear phosphoprotein 32-related protein [Zea mays]
MAAAAAGEDDAAWERAISAATKSTSAPKTLTLDGAVKSSTGGLPSAALLERFAASLEELSVAGARLSSLAGLPRLPALRRLSLPDNRLSGAAALAAVAEACGATLRHLDLGNNRFAEVQELAPLAGVRVESLDLFQCPVTKVKGYRDEVFALIPSLKYLDGADAEGNERLETDDDDDEEEDDEEGEEGPEGEEEGDEDDGEEEDGEAEDDELDADAEDKENIESKAGSSLPNKRKRNNEDDANGYK